MAGCVRNCCFEESDHPWLLHEVKLVPLILLRLSDDADVYDFDEKVGYPPHARTIVFLNFSTCCILLCGFVAGCKDDGVLRFVACRSSEDRKLSRKAE